MTPLRHRMLADIQIRNLSRTPKPPTSDRCRSSPASSANLPRRSGTRRFRMRLVRPVDAEIVVHGPSSLWHVPSSF
jgi:hypothetical protein